VVADGTAGLTRAGVVRVVLPDSGDIGVPVDASDAELNGGVGARPPRLDDAKTAARVVAWIRVRLDAATTSLPLTWVGLNAVRVDQLTTRRNLVVGAGDGRSGQEVKLPTGSIERASFQLAVEEPGRGFVAWGMVDELGGAGRDDAVFRLDEEAGVIRFGDGLRGRIPPTGARLLVLAMRSGGGALGNLPAGALGGLSGIGAPLTVAQPLPLSGGQDAETLDEAERRLPARLAHGDRAVVPEDFRRLALETPAVQLARAEVLPRFKPQQRLSDVTGVVSVMVIPPAQRLGAPNPRPDRTTLERVHAQLDARRALGCELYVIGVDYVPCALSVAVRLADGAERDATLRAVRTAVQLFCHPLAPGGRQGGGWTLGDPLREGELEVVVARVPGVDLVGGVRVFRKATAGWQLAPRDARAQTRLDLALWQLPEVQGVIVDDADAPSEDGNAFATTADDGLLVAIPTVPERC
jgi:predicted phage baseplate assembly protein